jgi:Uma2 family endonuclease
MHGNLVAARMNKVIDSLPVTFEDYLTRLDEHAMAEWVEGEIIGLAMPSSLHQRLLKFLAHLLDAYLTFRSIGEVFIAPYTMRFQAGEKACAREPDLFFVQTSRLDQDRSSYFDGPADLVIEIISAESVARDRGDKFLEYEAAAIPEYWLLDPRRRTTDFLILSEEGLYVRQTPDADGWYYSRVLPGFRLREDWLWRESWPSLTEIIAWAREMLSIEND